MAFAPGSGGGGAPPGQQPAQMLIPQNIPAETYLRLTQVQRDQLNHQRLLQAQLQTNGPGGAAQQQVPQQQHQQPQMQLLQHQQQSQQQIPQQNQQQQQQLQMNSQLLQALSTSQGQNLVNMLLMQQALQAQQNQSQNPQQLLQQQLAQQQAHQQSQQQAQQQAQQQVRQQAEQQAQQQAQARQQAEQQAQQQAHQQVQLAVQQQLTAQQYTQLLHLHAQQQQQQQLQQQQQQLQQQQLHHVLQISQAQQQAQHAKHVQSHQVQPPQHSQHQIQLQQQQQQQQQLQQLQQQQLHQLQLQQLLQQQQLNQQRAQAHAVQRPSVAPTPAPLASTPQLADHIAAQTVQLHHQLQQQQAHQQLLQQQAQLQQQQAQQQAQQAQHAQQQQQHVQHQPHAQPHQGRTVSQALQYIQSMQLQQAESTPNAESQEERLAQMLNEQHQQMLQNQAREAQHRQMLISSTPAPRGGITMGTPIGIARREEPPGPSTVPVTTTGPAPVRTPVAVPPAKQNSNPSMIPSTLSASATAPSSHQMLASSLSKTHEQPSSSKAASSSGNESMSDHISRIISENEVILQGDPVIRKKRPYHRQIGAQSSVDHDSNSGGSTRTSPGPRDSRMLQAASRSQSLFELSGSKHVMGSLTSGQPLFRPIQAHNDPNYTPECVYCKLTFPNEAGLQAHEVVCGKKKEMEKAQLESNPHSALKRRHTHQDATLAMHSPMAAQTPSNMPGPSEPVMKMKREESTSTADAQYSASSFPRSLPKEWEQHMLTLQNLAAIIPPFIQAFLAKVLQTKLTTVSPGTLKHIYEKYNISPIAIQQFLHFAAQLTDKQLEDMQVVLEKLYLDNAEEYQAKGIIQTLPCDDLEVVEMMKQQEAIMRGQIPELLVSTQAVLHHCSGGRDITDSKKSFVMIKLLHANGKDITEVPMKAETGLEECNTRFVNQMREIQKINDMNDRLIEILQNDPASAATTLFQVAREQSASMKFLLRQTGMVHLTIVASIAKSLGISNLQHDPNPSDQNQQQTDPSAYNGLRIKEEPEDAPEDYDEDDDCIIEVVDEDQKQQIAMFTAASKAQAAKTNSQTNRLQTSVAGAQTNRQSDSLLNEHQLTAVNNLSAPIVPNALPMPNIPVQGVQNSANMQQEIGLSLALQLKLEELRLEPQTNGDLDKPYWLVINDDIGARPTFMAAAGTTPRTHRTRNITSDTFVTTPRQQPMFAEQDGTLSMYANWALPSHTPEETKLNVSFMGQVSLRKRIGQHKFWKYTIANKDLGHYRMTHSSFWDVSSKIRDRQSSLSELKTPDNGKDYDAQFIERFVGGTYTNVDMQGSSNVSVTAPTLPVREKSVTAAPSTSSQPLLMRSPRPPTPKVDEENLEEMKPDESSSTSDNHPVLTDLSEEESVVDVAVDKASDARPTVIISDDAGRVKKERCVNKYAGKLRPKHEQIIGGHRTDEVYVYVRGRGRGRYICDRCGIRCKKPSMLKKHIKSHTDVRAFNCTACNFSFKTKGNLTKHLSSKTHQRRISNIQAGNESDGTTPSTSSMMNMEDGYHKNEPLFDDYDNNSSDEDDYDHLSGMQAEHKFKFGQEHILLERTAHTPPTRWCLVEAQNDHYWPSPDRRSCMSAPPVAMQNCDDRVTTPVSGASSPFMTHAVQSPISNSSHSNLHLECQSSYLPSSCSPIGSISPSNSQQCTNSQSTSNTHVATSVSSANNIIVPNINFLQKDEALKCDQCDRTFRKVSDLTLHQHTHNIELQQSKNRMYQCSECRIPMRTKALLQKHLERTHGVNMDESVTACIDPLASTQSVLGGPSTSNPRSFMCVDCDIGFRKHGILAKHLRSKTHVMKLESLQRLPVDTLSLITKKDNGACLNDIDTTDCEKARISLITIVEKLRNESDKEEQSGGATASPVVAHSVALTPEMYRVLANAANVPTTASTSNSPSTSQFPVGVATAPSVSAVSATGSQSNVSCVSSFNNSTMSPNPTVVPQVFPTPLPLSPLELSSTLSKKSPPLPAGLDSTMHSSILPKTILRISEVPPSLLANHQLLNNLSSSASLASHSHSNIHSSKTSPIVPSSANFNYRKRSESLMSGISTNALKKSMAWSHPLIEQTFYQPLPAFVPQPAEKVNTPESLSDRHHNKRPKPIPDITKCQICSEELPSPIDLQVHLHVDHFRMMDGAEYKCPKKLCGLNYESVESLRAHVKSHYESDQKKLLDEKLLLSEVDFPTDSSKVESVSSSKKEIVNKFTTPFKLISDHNEIYVKPGTAPSASNPSQHPSS